MPIIEQVREAFPSNDWLRKHSRNVTSQAGEDGILEKVFETLPDADKWCVEFGAWDGKKFSNTWNLLQNKGWSGVMIEANEKKFAELQQTYAGNQRVHCIRKFVDFKGPSSLDNLLSTTPIPKNPDLISIDVDGNDYHIWKSLATYRPKVVVIEFNPSIPNDIVFIQDPDFNLNHGNSLRALVRLGKAKGYELVSTTSYNGIFVDKKYFSLFNIRNNAIHFMYDDQPVVTKLWQLYDGSLMVGGQQTMLWHGVPIRHEDVQVLPAALRRFPDRQSA